MTNNPADRYDVVAVSLKDYTVRFLAERTSERNADAIVTMAVMRRGVEDEIFAAVPTGTYQPGDTWTGVETEDEARDWLDARDDRNLQAYGDPPIR